MFVAVGQVSSNNTCPISFTSPGVSNVLIWHSLVHTCFACMYPVKYYFCQCLSFTVDHALIGFNKYDSSVHICVSFQWRIQDFLEGVRQLPNRDYFANCLPKTA